MKKTLLLLIYGLFMVFAVNAQTNLLKTPSPAAVPKDDILQLKESGYSCF